MASVSCVDEIEILHVIVLEDKFNSLLVLSGYDRVISTANNNDCIVN